MRFCPRKIRFLFEKYNLVNLPLISFLIIRGSRKRAIISERDEKFHNLSKEATTPNEVIKRAPCISQHLAEFHFYQLTKNCGKLHLHSSDYLHQ
jgi:hypothetical protein